MQRRTLTQRAGHALAAAAGWRVVIPEHIPPRCVVIGAPHTSGWDLALTLLLMLAGELGLRWVGKESLFRGLINPALRTLGGIPVRREARGNFVNQMVAAFAQEQNLMLGILPEGTRNNTMSWKTGFYYIALGAQVPIVMGYADYRRKRVGLGPALVPSGDIQADFAVIRAFYRDIQGRHPSRQGPIVISADQDS